MFFKGKVTGSKYPYTVEDIETFKKYSNCQISAIGSQDWKPQEGDYVFCHEDSNEFCLIICRIRSEKAHAPSTGMQVGDNNNGLQIAEDGSVVTIIVGVNSIKYNENGISIDYEAMEEKGNGYIRKIRRADENGAEAMETGVLESLQSPTPDKMLYSREVMGSGTTTGVISRTIKLGTEGSVKYEEFLNSDGSFNVKVFSTWMFGDGANENFILGQKWKTFAEAQHDWISAHIHSTPSGPSGRGQAGAGTFDIAVDKGDIAASLSAKVFAKD